MTAGFIRSSFRWSFGSPFCSSQAGTMFWTGDVAPPPTDLPLKSASTGVFSPSFWM
ncbi:hypothetical protein D3C72_2558100 [compost metagenome]